MKKRFNALPDWEFHVDEVSANVYKVIATSKYGHTVSRMGVDVEKILEECRQDAGKISNRIS